MQWQRMLENHGVRVSDGNFPQLIFLALQRMEEAHGPHGEVPKTFHTIESHVLPMMVQALCLAPILDVPLELLLTVIAWHDAVILFDLPADSRNPLGMIRRHRGARSGDQPKGVAGNEAVSAQQMTAAMCKMGGYSHEDMTRSCLAAEVTYPGVDLGPDFKGAAFESEPLYGALVQQNPVIAELVSLLKKHNIDRGPHFFQPHLEEPLKRGEQVDPLALAMGLLDLGTCGLASPESGAFTREGNAEYRELHPNVPAHLERLLLGKTAQDREDRARVEQDLLAWWLSQPGFALWQLIRFERIMGWVGRNRQCNQDQIAQLRHLFRYYRDNVQLGLASALALQSSYRGGAYADSDFLFTTMGYQVCPVAYQVG